MLERAALIDASVKAALSAVDYCVIGAAALAARGVARFSADIDLLTFDARVLDSAFWSLTADIRRGDFDDPFAGVVRVYTAGVPHDVLVGRGKVMRHALATAEMHPRFGAKVATAPALVLLKLEAGGPIDVQDIHLLIAANPGLAESIDSTLLSPAASRLWTKLVALH